MCKKAVPFMPIMLNPNLCDNSGKRSNGDTGKVRAVYPCTPDYFWCTGPTCETLRLRFF